MSIQLDTAIRAILQMPYYKNDHAQTGGGKHQHEKKVAARLRDAGFKEQKKKIADLGRKMIKEWAITGDVESINKVLGDLKNGSFIIQPAGSQGFPDIIVKDFCGRFVCIECKSTEGVKPMWNDNLPKQDAIYIFSSEKTNATTCFLGKDVISDAAHDLYMRQIEQYKMIDAQFKPFWDSLDEEFNRGFFLRYRPQVNQGGKKAKTNYFEHQFKTQAEQNVLEFAVR